MNPLLEYLNQNFKNDTTNIVDHFLTTFGVNVKNHNDLYLFKYDMILTSFNNPVTKFCRGSILSFSNNTWKMVCHAMDKFWNWDEGYSPIFDESNFKTLVNQITLKEKQDGSLIHVYYHNGWCVSSSGSIVTTNINDLGITFEQLFYKTLKLDKETFLSKLNKDNVYIFELCTTANAIVTIYPDDRIYLLNIRNNEDGTYLPIEDVAKELQVLIPKRIFVCDLNIKTKDELISWVEANCNDDAECKFKEGFVGYINGIPAFKVKTNKYKFLHSFRGNNDKETRNNIIDAFFTESLDDVYESLHQVSKDFAESLRIKVIDCVKTVSQAIDDMKDKSFETQKDYALYVMANTPKMFNSFFFQNKNKILAKDADIMEHFTKFLTDNYKKYETYWKS